MTGVNNTPVPNMDDPVEPGINVWGLVGVVIFYILILVIGILASCKKTRRAGTRSEDVMLAGRDIGIFVGIFTMTATWVGGGYINGTAEVVYTPGYGLVWAQAPIGYSISLLLGGLLFAKKMRKARYVTLLDPFEERFGPVMAAFLYIPALLGELFWTAAILSALGASLRVILNLSDTASIMISAGISVFYTFIGGLYSVAFTDVVQLICIFIGLWLGVGFSLYDSAVTPITETSTEWVGTLAADEGIGGYIDSFLLLMFGGIPWQVYFQRVLSARSERRAMWLSFAAAFGCIVMAVPAVLIGAIGHSADWNQTDYPGRIPIPEEDYKLILPLVLQYLTPPVVAVIGLGAVSAAVMSSADSSVLSASSMFAKNVYIPFRNALSKGKAGETEIIWVLRFAIVIMGILATIIAITVNSIYGLWYLCSDLVYCILFPQLLTVIYLRFANTYGSVAGYITGWVFRLISGEPLLKLTAAVKYPQWFLFKTMAMLISLFTIIVVSKIMQSLFQMKYLSPKVDLLGAFIFKDGGVLTRGTDKEDDNVENQTKPSKNGRDNPALEIEDTHL